MDTQIHGTEISSLAILYGVSLTSTIVLQEEDTRAQLVVKYATVTGGKMVFIMGQILAQHQVIQKMQISR